MAKKSTITRGLELVPPPPTIALVPLYGEERSDRNNRNPERSDATLEERLRRRLDRRASRGTLRSLLPLPHSESASERNRDLPSSAIPSIDFASNDYLSLSRSSTQHEHVASAYDSYVQSNPGPTLGATGSRLLSGDSHLARGIESHLAKVHNRDAALLMKSGYDANLSILSSVPLEGDVVIMDELVHNSLIMGVRMGRVRKEDVRMFRHNDVSDLRRVLSSSSPRGGEGQVLVVVESVYSMDGDVAPLSHILNLAKAFGAGVVVDEAHGLGVYGRTNPSDLSLPEDRPRTQPLLGNKQESSTRIGVRAGSSSAEDRTENMGGTGVLAALDLESHPSLLASVHTFGKAAGCHGAVITGSQTLIQYLVNYAWPFVYSTALPPHSLFAIQCAYQTITGMEGERLRQKVFGLVNFFRSLMRERLPPGSEGILLQSPSPIQAVLVAGNDKCVEACEKLRRNNFDVYPIRSPTVPKGSERIRIILHVHNTDADVIALVNMLVGVLRDMGLLEVEGARSRL